MFANTQAAGVDQAFADVCLTPPVPVPVPYQNVAQGSMAANPVPNVYFASAQVHNLSTVVPTTSGDEPGVATGVSSGTVMSKSVHVTGSNSVLVGGMPVTRLTSQTLQNSANISGARVAPSQTKVLILAP
jgi:hypothetical protein